VTAGIIGLVTTALTLLASVLGWLAKNKEARDARTYANDTQTMDTALASSDAGTVSRLFDELREPAGEGDPGGPGSNAAGERQLPGDAGVAP
jgi:hypothetical protein